MASYLKLLVLFLQQHGAPRALLLLVKFIINFLPFVGIWTLFLWSYYIYVFKFCFMWMLKTGARSYGHSLACLGFYHFFGLLAMASHFRCVFTSPKITAEDRARLALEPADERHCDSCHAPKPRRTHHCFWCETCVLKMDHHCPWLGNCVGHNNYKYFCLMLFYTFIFGLYCSISLGFHPEFHASGKSSIVSVGFALSVGVSLLAGLHAFLLFTNRTTMECGMRVAECTDYQRQKHKYDLGVVANLDAVLGTNRWLWMFPTTPHWTDPRTLRPGITQKELEGQDSDVF